MRRQSRGDRREVTAYSDYEVHVVGADAPSLEDAYSALLTCRWPIALSVLTGSYLSLNALFALAYRLVGGVSHVESFLDAFFFSVQTMGTIGYGTMAPTSTAAHFLVVVESLCGLLVTALTTGLVFARFSRTRAKVRFSSRAAICLVDGAPNLTVRVGNERRAPIAEGSFRMTLTRTTVTKEGVTLYRAEQLPLAHDRAPLLTRALTMRHIIDEKSPLFADTPETFERGEVELTVAATGTDEATLQPVHARATIRCQDIVWGARLADLMSEPAPNRMELDLRKFHDLVRCEATPDFPYSTEPGSDAKSR